MPAPMTFSARAARKLPRVKKTARQWLRVALAGGRPPTRVIFVVGSQRSGTRLPLQVLDHAPGVMTYSEGTSPFFRGVLLEPMDALQRDVARSAFPIVVLKPICEAHRLPELLDAFPQSKGIWIFRRYQDAVNSASTKWKSGKEAVRRLACGNLAEAGWRAGGLSRERLELVRQLYSDSLSLHAANAIMWFLRNALFFDLGVDRRPDVLLVRYEDLVTRPLPSFARVADFVDVPLPDSFQKDVFSSSVSKRPFPAIPDEIADICGTLERRLVAHYEAALASAPRAAGADGLVQARPVEQA